MAMNDSSADLGALLRRFADRYPDAQASAVRFTEFLASSSEVYLRTHAPGHITGSAWVVDRRGSSVLLTHHRKLGRWLQLGGHADGDTDVARVALREAEEESGLAGISLLSPEIFDIDIHEIPPRGNEPAHLHYDVRFLMCADSTAPLIMTDESNSLRWVALEELSNFTDEPSMLRMAERWKESLRRNEVESSGGA